MKMILCGFLLCISCGDAVDKKTNTNNGENNGIVINNGENNGVGANNGTATNNGKVNECKPNEQKATVNGVTGCYAKCDIGCSGNASCQQGICVSSANNNVCDNNADCTVNQECRETCLDHLFCGDTDYNNPDYQWARCSNDKEYTGACDNGSCDCIVNGTLVKSFPVTSSPLRNDAHRVFNTNCEWLVPSL